ncbi:MAG: hypothetical protein KF874_10375 [Rhizobiaceae bacterium]|nr:hypothetical protein [Rhizobiaceae bacterium]
MSARIRPTLLATVIVLGALTHSAQSDQQLVFTIPEPPVDQQAKEKPRCVPSRMVGIAESAEDYYSSCDEPEKAN